MDRLSPIDLISFRIFDAMKIPPKSSNLSKMPGAPKNQKKKVHAQRKFAQGAFIPPPSSAVNNLPERRVDLTGREEYKTIYNSISAKSLLDIVSFKTMHLHLQPVVMLERIQTPAENPQPSNATATVSRPPARSLPKANKSTFDMKLRSRVGSCRTGIRIRKKITRSRYSPDMITVARKPKRKRSANAVSKLKRVNVPKKRTTTVLSDTFDFEDYKPLTFFVNNHSAQMSTSSNVEGRTNSKGKNKLCPGTVTSAQKRRKRSVDRRSANDFNIVTRSRSKSVPRTYFPSTCLSVSSRSTSNESLATPQSRLEIIAKDKTVARGRLALARDISNKEITCYNINSSVLCDQDPPIRSRNNSLSNNSETDHISVHSTNSTDTVIIPTIVTHPNRVRDPPLESEPTPVIEDDTQTNIADLQSDNTLLYINQELFDGADDDKKQIVLNMGPVLNVTDSLMNSDETLIEKTKDIDEQSCTSDIIRLVPPDDYLEAADTSAVIHPSTNYQYYGNSRIQNWIINSSQQQDSARSLDDPDTKIPVVVIDDCIPSTSNADRLLTENPLDRCPLKRYRTLNDICSAKEEEIIFCGCSQCKIIRGVYVLIHLLDTSEASKNHVYDFDDFGDGERQLSLKERRRLRMTHMREMSELDCSKRRGRPVFLDVLPRRDQETVELKVPKVPNERKYILNAKLVPKTRARNCPLIDRQDLLVDVIKTLGFSLDAPDYTVEVVTKWDSTVLKYAETYNSAYYKNSFPGDLETAQLVDAPIYHPTEEEFQDPISYFEKIMPAASQYGLCKVVPPEGFKPTCSLRGIDKFVVSNQYIGRLYNRWSGVTREMCTIRAYLKTQNVVFTKAPLVEGLEINLSKLYHLVQSYGGLQNVIRKKRWPHVAEVMRFTKGPNPGNKLDILYEKYLLPYDAMSISERHKLMCLVEKAWQAKYHNMLERALNPLSRLKRILDDPSDSLEEEIDETSPAIMDAEECIIPGRRMHIDTFKMVAHNAMDTYFTMRCPTTTQIEEEYWRLVLLNKDHLCVNSASIDTGYEGLGFTKNKNEKYFDHPWNLKVLSENGGNVLSSLGPVLGVTVPTLHLGMVFSTSCWHRDPHGLPWIEYVHSGPGKIWYGIPDEQSNNFRNAVETLCPTSCQNKTIWLPSDIMMIPPILLKESNVSLSRVEQNPGEYIIVFPKAYSSSISLGLNKSESVYFATKSWLDTVHQVFEEARESCEPTMFSLEQLLISVSRDPRAELSVLQQVHSNLETIINKELNCRQSIRERIPPKRNNKAKAKKKRPTGTWSVRDCNECNLCRSILYLSMTTGLKGKKTMLCLQHTEYLLKKHAHMNCSNLELTIFVSDEELQEILNNLRKRIGYQISRQSPQPGPSSAPP